MLRKETIDGKIELRQLGLEPVNSPLPQEMHDGVRIVITRREARRRNHIPPLDSRIVGALHMIDGAKNLIDGAERKDAERASREETGIPSPVAAQNLLSEGMMNLVNLVANEKGGLDALKAALTNKKLTANEQEL